MKQDSYRPGAATELIDHIIDTHYRYQRDVVPRITELIRQLHASDSDSSDGLVEQWKGFRNGLELHLMMEGRVLFPAIREFSKAERAGRAPDFVGAGLDKAFQRMRDEHRKIEAALESLVAEAQRIGAADLGKLLQDLQSDLLTHIGEEEDELWWQARALEERVMAANGA